MVTFYGLRFIPEGKVRVDEYEKELEERIEAEKRGEEWAKSSYEYLGYEGEVIRKGPWKGDIEKLQVMWWRFVEGGPNGFFETYFDRNHAKNTEPVKEEESEELCYKYTKFLSFMKGFRRLNECLLEDIENDYNLEFHAKPDIIKNTIDLKCKYNNSTLDVITFENLLNEYDDKKFILNEVNSKLSETEQQTIRQYRAKKVLKEFYQTLKKEVPTNKQKLLVACLKNEQPTPSNLEIYVNTYKNLKTNLEQNIKQTDIIKFDETVNTLYETAKNELIKGQN